MCAINKEKGLNDYASGFLRPLILYYLVPVFLFLSICTYCAVDLFSWHMQRRWIMQKAEEENSFLFICAFL